MNLKAKLEAKLGPISNQEFGYAYRMVEEKYGVHPVNDCANVVLDWLSTFIDEFRRVKC